jgi:uncharacterized alkaline shock family protein YloU
MSHAASGRSVEEPERGHGVTVPAQRPAEPAPPEQRGRTLVCERVASKIACGAALEVPGVRQVSRRDGGLPWNRSSAAHVRGDEVEVGLNVVVDYPAPLREVAGDIRSHVATQVGELTGLRVSRVDVTMTELAPGERPATDAAREGPPHEFMPPYHAADRAAIRAFRPLRRISSTIVAALLTLLGILLAGEVVSSLLGSPWLRYDGMLAWVRSTPWSNPLFLVGAAIATLIGLLLLALALVPGRPRLVPVRTGDPDLIMGIRRRSFARALARAAESVPGVHSARVSIRGHTAAVTADTSGWGAERFGDAVRDAVLSRLATLDTVEPYGVTVNVKERR